MGIQKKKDKNINMEIQSKFINNYFTIFLYGLPHHNAIEATLVGDGK
jgi:hypothetical protein